MYRAATFLTILVTMLWIACGGGGTETEKEAAQTPAAGEATPIPITVSAQGLDPQQMEIEVGEWYKFVFTNNMSMGATLMAPRWGVQAFAAAGTTDESAIFSESVAGEYTCWERNFGKNPAFKCVVVVK